MSPKIVFHGFVMGQLAASITTACSSDIPGIADSLARCDKVAAAALALEA